MPGTDSTGTDFTGTGSSSGDPEVTQPLNTGPVSSTWPVSSTVPASTTVPPSGTVPPSIRRDQKRMPATARVLEATAGVLSAGVLLVSLALLISIVLSPALITGTGLSAATGPRWDRVLPSLAIGVAGEGLHLTRRRLGPATRVTAAVLTIVMVVAVLWWGWWR